MSNKTIPLALSYDDVLLVPQYSNIHSRSGVDPSTQITPHVKLQIPLISSNMDTVTGINMAIALGKLGGLGVLPRFNMPNEQADMIAAIKKQGCFAAAALGIKDEFMDRAKALVSAGVDMLVIDVAHGHMQRVLEVTKVIKKTFPKVDLVSGNVATSIATEALFKAGADCVKVGIGPAAICTTRIVTGFGIPQITAVMEASKIAKRLKKTIICDGGIKNSGDIVKGLAAGSHAVMIGKLFAGTDESPGEIVIKDGKKFKQYNGSTSSIEKRRQVERLGQKNLSKDYVDYVEGVSALVAYKGPLARIVTELSSGIRSGLSYAGAKNIKQLHRNAQFVQVTAQGVRESNSHDVILQPDS